MKRRFGRVRKLPSGRYQARYRGPDGQDHPAPTTFANKREAERFLSLAEADIAQGRWLMPQAAQMTVRDWCEQWFVPASTTWKVKTRQTYRSVLDRLILPHLGEAQLATLRPITVSKWCADLVKNLSPSQARQAVRLLSQIMHAAIVNDLIAANPCRTVKLPRLPEADPVILTVEQVDRLAAVCQEDDRLMVLAMAYGGLRIGEVLALRRRSIDLDGNRVVVSEAVAQVSGGTVVDTPKNHQRRAVRIPSFLVDLLRARLADLADDPYVFVFPGRRAENAHLPQSYTGFKKRFIRAVAVAGLAGVTAHDLRATHASWVADSHGVLVAARRLGHANASVTTRHYARPMDGRDGEVAEHLDRQRAQEKGSGTQRAREENNDH
ncbi:tyrosine-type recombinase/integrase [Catellatospora tritici]|uniref:tyrosine-type recombinase/integrase n=1 Tax=Catellatospora tritici TaxID=2851566 RepID=UPI001C2DD2C6|nr:site-specific integrase [Catellatospora tritici]MBV1856649.1 site-specific integrase [Catellatospora tritici]